MLKRLLYLYNDGHNPFPKLGKGGLGYHLPQYRKRMHGESVVHLGGGDYSYFNDDLDYEYDQTGFIEGSIPTNIRDDYDKWVKEQKSYSHPILYKPDPYDEDTPEGYENISNRPEIESNLKELEDLEPNNYELRIMLTELNKGPKINGEYISQMNREKLLKGYNNFKQIEPKPIKMHESMKKIGNVNANISDIEKKAYDKKVDETNQKVDSELHYFLKKYSNIILSPEEKAMLRQELFERKMAGNIKGDINFNIIENLRKALEIGTSGLEQYNLLKKENVPYEEKINILKKYEVDIYQSFNDEFNTNYKKPEKINKFIQEFKDDNPKTKLTDKQIENIYIDKCSGKALESYYLTDALPIVETIAGYELDVNQELGSNPLIPEDKKDYCFIDLFSYNSTPNSDGEIDGIINEIKNYNIELIDDPYDPNNTKTYLAIQLTKLEGTKSVVLDEKTGYAKKDKNGTIIKEDEYKMIFYQDDKTGEYFPEKIDYKGKSITTDKIGNRVNINQFNVLSTSNKGTAYVDLRLLVNDPEFIKINHIKMIPVGDLFTLKFKTYIEKDEDGDDLVYNYNYDNMYGGTKPSIRIPINKFNIWSDK